MPHSLERKKHRLALGGVLGLFVCTGAAAQTQTDASVSLDRQTERAFREVLQKPQDLSGWSKYAQLLLQAGNYEGGIAALERLLLDPQASPDLRVDIAVLYYRLASYAMAEGMLRDALADSRLTGEKRAFANALLSDVIKRNRRNQLSGSVAVGVRYQTNPMYRTDSATVLASGTPVPVAANQRPESDTDVNVGLNLRHVHDLDRQNSAAIVSTFGAYLVDYTSASGSQLQANPTEPYDLLVLDLTTGLQFKPMPASASGLTMRPHILVSNVTAQRHQYLYNQGLGLDVNWRASERTLYELTVNGQHRAFADRIDITNAKQLDGRLYGLRARVSHEVGAGQVLAGEYFGQSNRTERDFYDYDSHELRVSYSISYASPVSQRGYWTTAFWLGALDRRYGAPDPSVSPTETREDREWRVGISQTVHLAPLWSLLLGAEYQRNNANIANFRYKNTSLSSAVVRSF